MQIALPLLVALVGLLMWALCTNGLLKEVGKIAFACGLLAFLLTGSGPLIKLLNG